MNRRTLLGLTFALILPAAALARATREDAQAMVKKAIDFYKKKGRDAALQEFARDFYLLDQSGVHETKDGMSLYPTAATGTKGTRSGSLRVVTQRGEEKLYYGLTCRSPNPVTVT